MPCRRQPNNYRRPPSSTPGSIRRSMNAPLVDNDEPMMFIDDGTGNWEGTVRDPEFGSIGGGGGFQWTVRSYTSSQSLAAYDFVLCDGSAVSANCDFTVPAASSNSGKEIIVRVENHPLLYTVQLVRSGSDTFRAMDAGTGAATTLAFGGSTVTKTWQLISDGSSRWYYWQLMSS